MFISQQQNTARVAIATATIRFFPAVNQNCMVSKDVWFRFSGSRQTNPLPAPRVLVAEFSGDAKG